MKNDLTLKVCKPTMGKGKAKKRVLVDWNGMYGYSKEAKSKDNPKGFCCEAIWEGDNKVLRIFAPKYTYLDAEQATKLLGILARAMQKTLTETKKPKKPKK